MKYVNIRVLELSIKSSNKGNYDLHAEDNFEDDDFSFDEDEQDDFLDEMIKGQMDEIEKNELDHDDSNGKIQYVNMSDFYYSVKNLLINAYRISTLEDTFINGVPVTLINLGNKNVVVSFLTTQQLLNLIALPEAVVNQEVDMEEEKELLVKLNNPNKLSAKSNEDSNESLLD